MSDGPDARRAVEQHRRPDRVGVIRLAVRTGGGAGAVAVVGRANRRHPVAVIFSNENFAPPCMLPYSVWCS